mmetsp:Transcript_31238/g.56706  ORF Transcript_31238/g.56706 Transcript_31238/m.56706 type:complete len:477 (-) Transcript_31238:3378-4808(-)|eukprot:CAMPEP_0175064860 /NCGR_PEP_ID=MMETSP0052_2-20121109/15584_1 /TAXON_ID=51329 ORGANISM="Polytomella parva, Strain SAG 63-3" /NCGR_SAMPLE_ID=MMETSP0052_2 /ASSEMBLY_ACC=CAM_ASM_000194 /LENGTH=476 /DNA_ID=CAMNT_0016331291 /DNA_START=46 /DNA_END=1476 /DNA_ORIENTATION=+
MSQHRSQAFTVIRAAARLKVLAARAKAKSEHDNSLEEPILDTEAGKSQSSITFEPTESQNGHTRADISASSFSGAPKPAATASRSLLSISEYFPSSVVEAVSDIKVHWFIRDYTAMKEIVFSSYINLLLLCLPLGIFAGCYHWNPVLVFFLNFLSLIPLALILGDITEDLALHFGDIVGGLLNATFGNVVEVILSLVALTKGLYDVVICSLLGSILSNVLLVMGCSFFFGGLFNRIQSFSAAGNQAHSSLLYLAAISYMIPTAAPLLLSDKSAASFQWELDLSHGVAVVLLICYGCYLIFQLKTHADLFEEEEDDEDGKEEPMMTVFTSIFMLAVITGFVAIASEFLASSIEKVSISSGISGGFLAMILLPIAGNACEHLTAVKVAVKNKMELAMGVAIGSGIQIAMFALPLAEVVGWVTGHPMTLNLGLFPAMLLMGSIIHSNVVTSSATTHWLLGVQLIALYIIIAMVYLFYKD